MSGADKKNRSVEDTLGGVVIAFSMTISLIVASVLFAANMSSLHVLRVSQEQATMVPAGGKLLGWSATDGSAWAPGNEKNEVLLLFGVAAGGHLGDAEFWRQVEIRSRKAGAAIRLVGLCITEEVCRPISHGDLGLTLLKFMDPIQTHALAVGAEQAQAFIYRSGQNLGRLQLTPDVDALVARLAEASHPRLGEGGA